MLWDWSAAFLGLGPSEGMFLPTYWRLFAHLTRPFGFVFEPMTVLIAILLLVVVLWSALFWSKRVWPHVVMFVLMGLLLADSPLALALPILSIGACYVVDIYAAKHEIQLFKVSMSGQSLLTCLFLGLAVSFVSNLLSAKDVYFRSYAGNARVAISDPSVRHPQTVWAIDGLLDRYVEEIVAEAGSCDRIFTDGVCDTGIATAAWSQGKTLRTIPLVGPHANESCVAWSGLCRLDDLAALRKGAGNLLRLWAVDHPERLDKVAFQSGFAFVLTTVRQPLANAGLVLRTSAVSSEDRHRAAGVLTALATDICALCRERNVSEGGFQRERRFRVMQWCVEEALRRLSEDLGREGQIDVVRTMIECADDLLATNPMSQDCRVMTTLASWEASQALTPREELTRSLRSADFKMASTFARTILEGDARDVEANFAMGMSCFHLGKYAEARHYLLRALESKPKDSALLNNVAMASLELGDLETAERYALDAVKVAPNVQEIRDTLDRVKAAQKRGKAE